MSWVVNMTRVGVKGEEKCIQLFGAEIRRKETNWKLALTVNRISYSFSKLLEVALPHVSDMKETSVVGMQGPKSDHSLKHVELSGIPYICCEKLLIHQNSWPINLPLWLSQQGDTFRKKSCQTMIIVRRSAAGRRRSTLPHTEQTCTAVRISSGLPIIQTKFIVVYRKNPTQATTVNSKPTSKIIVVSAKFSPFASFVPISFDNV